MLPCDSATCSPNDYSCLYSISLAEPLKPTCFFQFRVLINSLLAFFYQHSVFLPLQIIHVENNSDTLQVKEAEQLLAFLLKNANGRSRTTLKSFLAHRQVFVNGRCITQFNHPLRPGDRVNIGKVSGIKEAPSLPKLKIVFEDEHLLVINKESGLLSIATEKEKAMTAYSILSRYVKSLNPNNKIFVVHRLDREASGLMLFSKSQQVQESLQHSWQEAVHERSYAVLVEGCPEQDEGRIESWLKENKNLVMYSSRTPGDGQQAISHYRVLRKSSNYSILEVSLETGRKNQIRVHMNDLGHPIAGDKKYGARSNPLQRLGLHARVLHFFHPVTGEEKRFETPVPAEFMRCIKEERQEGKR
jgi:23S rRNA pseudouridine1911/1915/1917 synthase